MPTFDVSVSMATDINKDPQDFAKPLTTLIISRWKQSANARSRVYLHIKRREHIVVCFFYQWRMQDADSWRRLYLGRNSMAAERSGDPEGGLMVPLLPAQR